MDVSHFRGRGPLAGGLAVAALVLGLAGSAGAQDSVTPRIEDLAGLEMDMVYPPLPAPLEWMGGACFGTPADPVCGRSYSLLTGTGGAYAALVSGAAAGQLEDGSAQWTLIDMVALPFATTEQTFYVGPECTGGPAGTAPVLFFDRWPEDGTKPTPIWGADVNLTTGMITLAGDLAAYDCTFEEP